jgi:hypothetical protein
MRCSLEFEALYFVKYLQDVGYKNTRMTWDWQYIETHRIMMTQQVELALSQRRLLSKSSTPDAVFVKVQYLEFITNFHSCMFTS